MAEGKKKKSLCKTQRRKQEWLPRGLGLPELTVCPPGGPWTLWSPYSSGFNGQRHMESSWKTLVSCPTHWAKCTNVIYPFFGEKTRSSGSTVLWESVWKYRNCFHWGCFRQVVSNISWTLISPELLLWLSGAPLPWPLCTSPTSLSPTCPGLLWSWSLVFLLPFDIPSLFPHQDLQTYCLHSPESLQD